MNNLKEGTVVSVPKGPVEHVGITASKGQTVISNSGKYGKVIEQKLTEFSNGKKISVKGYISNLPSWQVVKNARSYLNEKYHLINNNCEHLVTKAHGKEKMSPQLRGWLFGLSLLSLMLLVVWDMDD